MPARSVEARPKHARRRPTSRARALTVLGGLAATALPLVGTGTAEAASAADWQKLAMCESGGNWSINTGNGYYGGLQFSSGTWLGYGGGAYASRADLASPTQQMAIADKVLVAQGWNAWPSCSRSTGLYGSPTTPSPAPAPPPPPPMVYGDILARYNALGGAGGLLGAPLNRETGSIRGGRWNFFQHGAIYWTPQHGAYEVHGYIREKWQAMGSEFSLQGYPTSNEAATPTQYGAYNIFENGAVYWSPGTGAHELHGLIQQAWAASGWENGPEGFPVGDELALAGRDGALQGFQGGAIAWSPGTGAHLVRGSIHATWAGLGSDRSKLGLPTSNEFGIGNGARRSVFEHGTITWSPVHGVRVQLS